jgi:signal transduction histidine kinase
MSIMNRFALRLRHGLSDHLAIRLIALIILVNILWLNLLLWPISWLGHTFDPLSGRLIAIAPGSAVDHAGLQVGDRIVQIYGLPLSEVLSHPNLLEIIGPRDAPIPIVVERDGMIETYNVVRQPPTVPFQLMKVSNLVLALLCWLTGYLLGIVRHAEAPRLAIVGLFWLLFGGVLGSYTFAASLSVHLRIALLWFILSGLLPLSVAIHAWFPIRNGSMRRFERAYRWFVASTIGLNLLLIGLVFLVRPSLVHLSAALGFVVPWAVLVAIVMATMLLLRDYGQITIAHVRRQIRVILLAFVGVGSIWALAFLIPLIIDQPALLADQMLNVIAVAIPLAYVLIETIPDLYRVDRLIGRITGHLLVMLVVAAMLAIATTVFALEGTVGLLWIALAAVMLYSPIHRLVLWLPRLGNQNGVTYAPLVSAMNRLAASLDDGTLTQVCHTAMKQTFAPHGFALYLCDEDVAPSRLHLRVQHGLVHLPTYVPQGVVHRLLISQRVICENRSIYAAVVGEQLKQAEEAIIQQPGIVLWCPIVDAQETLLGVLLLGRRDNGDPYRSRDRQEIQRFIDATALAFANSSAYRAQLHAQETIRSLYRQVQVTQEATASTIARELHDELINVNMRLNITAIQRLMAVIPAEETALHNELQLILEAERMTVDTLRLVCRRLEPVQYDDLYGFGNVLRLLVERYEPLWNVPIALEVRGDPVALSAENQREAARIAREALTNALKHAEASQIQVMLSFPEAPAQPVVLSICDNGRTGQAIAPKVGHSGLWNMQQSARSIDGHLTFDTSPDGTIVRLSFVPEVTKSDAMLVAYDQQ